MIAAAFAAAALKPPVIHELFTPLPCPKHALTTQAMEGCAERRILRSDRRIDGQVAAAFPLVYGVRARRSFVQGEVAWLRYRRGSCEAEASKYTGGTIAPVIYAGCVEERNETHLRDLIAVLRELRRH